MLAVQANPEIRPSRGYWVAWFTVHVLVGVGIGSYLSERAADITMYLAFVYPIAFGAAQAFLLYRFTPGSWRTLIAGVGSLASFALYLPLLLLLWVVSAGASGERGRLIGYLLMGVFPLVGGAVTGLVQRWAMQRHWQHAERLVWVHTALAFLVSVLAAVIFHDTVSWQTRWGPPPLFPRLAFGAAMGLVIAGVIGAVVLRLPRRPDVVPEVAHDEPAPPAEPAPTIGRPWTWPGRGDIAIWVAAHVAFFVALNWILPTVPRFALFCAFVYGPTVGVLQALLLRWQYAPRANWWTSWVAPALLLPTIGAVLATIPTGLVMYLGTLVGIRSPVGRNPAGLPLVTAEWPAYVLCVGAGLTLGWLHWRQLRSQARGRWWSVLFLAAEGVAPLVAIFTADLVALVPGYRPRYLGMSDSASLYTEAGAALAGLAVALVVGVVAWLCFRPAPRDSTVPS